MTETLIGAVIVIAVLAIAVGIYVIREAIILRREEKMEREKFRRRWPTGCRPLMALLVLCAAVARSQDPPTICGLNLKGPNEISRHTELIQVSCIDWAALAKIGALPVPMNKAPQTQVLVHARAGESFVVTLDGHKQAGVLYDRPDGLKAGMVVYDGDQYKDIKVSIQGELP